MCSPFIAFSAGRAENFMITDPAKRERIMDYTGLPSLPPLMLDSKGGKQDWPPMPSFGVVWLPMIWLVSILFANF